MFKLIRRVLTVLLVLILSVSAYYLYQGYALYQEVLETRSLEARVQEVTAMENYTSYEQLDPLYINAVISAEDRRFFSHGGIDLIATIRAIWTDLQARSFVQGGSTITQQVSKNLLFDQEKKLTRKTAELFAVHDIESKYSKQEIFALYVNTAYFGSGNYGIYEASTGYFDKLPKDLSDGEAVFLAAMPNAPSIFSEEKEPRDERIAYILSNMVKNGYLSAEEASKIQSSHP